jgi:phage shock protein E
MGLFSFLGNGTLKKALRQEAMIIDVRSASEYDRGHVPGSLNIPVDRIGVSVPRIKNLGKPVICVCASGHRSRIATNALKQAGMKDVHNGGSWERVMGLIESL